MLDEIVGIYEAYSEDFHRRIKKRKAFDGVFGFRGSPQNYPCHEEFIQNLGRALKDFASRSPDSAQAAEVLRYIYCTAPACCEAESTVYWMLLAAHSLTFELIASLDASGAQALYSEYEAQYPRRTRLPVQIKVLKALAERAKAG